MPPGHYIVKGYIFDIFVGVWLVKSSSVKRSEMSMEVTGEETEN